MFEDMVKAEPDGVVSLVRQKDGSLEIWVTGKFNRLESVGALNFIINDILTSPQDPAYEDGPISPTHPTSE